MIKIVFLADTHLGFDFPLRPKKERKKRGLDFFKNFDTVLNYAKEIKADLVIHGGDLFYRTLVPLPIVDLVYERIFNLAQCNIPIVIVPGNHESSKLPVSLFVNHANIYYYKKPGVFKFKLKHIHVDIAGFPCVREDVRTKFPEILKEIEKKLSKNSVKLICMHQSIEGAKVGPSDFTFRYGPDVIAMNDMPSNYDLILSGHIHRSQILTSPNYIPIIYPGSTDRTSFAEKDEEKGFYEIVISDDLKITYKFVGLNTRPMLDIQLEKAKYSFQELKKEILDKMNVIPKDSIIRFKMKYIENLVLLNSKLLEEIIPQSMNYQISGLKDLFLKKD